MTNEELQIIATAAKEGAFNAALISLKPWLNIKEAAMYLGVSEAFIYKACESGKITCNYAKTRDDLRGKILIAKAELDKFPKKSDMQKIVKRVTSGYSVDSPSDIVKNIISVESRKQKAIKV